MKDLKKSREFYETLGFRLVPPPADGFWRRYGEHGLKFTAEAAPGKGPAFALLTDPDGNPVLLDQH